MHMPQVGIILSIRLKNILPHLKREYNYKVPKNLYEYDKKLEEQRLILIWEANRVCCALWQTLQTSKDIFVKQQLGKNWNLLIGN